MCCWFKLLKCCLYFLTLFFLALGEELEATNYVENRIHKDGDAPRDKSSRTGRDERIQASKLLSYERYDVLSSLNELGVGSTEVEGHFEVVPVQDKLTSMYETKQPLNANPLKKENLPQLKDNKKEAIPEVGETKVTYIGAVLEYEPYKQWTEEEKGFGVLRENANTIVNYAEEAKRQFADLLIAPEYGLQSLDMYYNSTANFLTFTQLIPDPAAKMIPCDLNNDTKYFEAMHILSCGARRNQIYLIVDMAELYPCSNATFFNVPWELSPSNECPETGYVVYNTQAVFDREGAVIARYRKQNLFLEDYFTPGPLDDTSAIFVTDFNVAFTLQVCFDIVYEHPGYSNVRSYGIRDVAMSTAWADSLPFDLADAIQNGWSRGLRTNLLVSGYHDPENYKLGSGIFRAFTDEEQIYTFDKNSGNVLLVAPVTTITASSLGLYQAKNTNPDSFLSDSGSSSRRTYHNSMDSGLREENRTHSILHDDLSNYTKVLLTKGDPGQIQNITACSYDNLCCDLSYEYSGNLTYYFLVYSGESPVGDGQYFLGIQQCGIVWCRNSDWRSCALVELGIPESDFFGPFKISSSSFSSDLIYSIGNVRDLSLISNHILYYEDSDNGTMIGSEDKIDQLLTVALYGRWYDRDH